MFVKDTLDASGLVKFMFERENKQVTEPFICENGHAELIADRTVYHIKFSKEPFYTFHKFFPKYKEDAETINKDILDTLTDDDVIIFAYPKGIRYSDVRTIKKLNLIYNQRNGETVYCVPLSKLTEFW